MVYCVCLCAFGLRLGLCPSEFSGRRLIRAGSFFHFRLRRRGNSLPSMAGVFSKQAQCFLAPWRQVVSPFPCKVGQGFLCTRPHMRISLFLSHLSLFIHECEWKAQYEGDR